MQICFRLITATYKSLDNSNLFYYISLMIICQHGWSVSTYQQWVRTKQIINSHNFARVSLETVCFSRDLWTLAWSSKSRWPPSRPNHRWHWHVQKSSHTCQRASLSADNLFTQHCLFVGANRECNEFWLTFNMYSSVQLFVCGLNISR